MAVESIDIQYVGNYRPKPTSRAYDKTFWTSEVHFNGQSHCMVDAAGMNDDRQNVVNMIPYGPRSRAADDFVSDGDLLAYIRERNKINIGLDIGALLPLFKGRASHAELCYRKDATARHISLWDAHNPIIPTDCRAFHDHADGAALGIYRISLKEYDVDERREAALKNEVKRWKEIVRPVDFPNGFALNFDPVDFADIGALSEIARKFLSHSPLDPHPPVGFKMNCVQWSTLVLSLAICFPLTRKVVASLGAKEAFELNWLSHVNGYAEDGLIGLGELPIPFYSPDEVIENALDMYLPDMKKEILELVRNYPVEAILESKGLRSDMKVIMPSAFIIENRLRSLGLRRKTKTIFNYVATALPENELTQI